MTTHRGIQKIVTHRNLRQTVYQRVRAIVLSNDVQAGAKINEEMIAGQLGVSKTPVREALSKLAHDGVVRIIPNRGAFKLALSGKEIEEIMLIREVLEGLCVRLAVKNVTAPSIRKLKNLLDSFEKEANHTDFSTYARTHQKFHQVIYNLSKSPRLRHLIESMYELSDLLRTRYFRKPERVAQSLQGHRELIAALERKDGVEAESIRKTMVRNAAKYLTEEAEK